MTEELKTDQDNLPKTEVDVSKPEYELDLNNLPKIKHNWVKRGIVVSCEGAGHPSHRHFLTERRRSK